MWILWFLLNKKYVVTPHQNWLNDKVLKIKTYVSMGKNYPCYSFSSVALKEGYLQHLQSECLYQNHEDMFQNDHGYLEIKKK